MVCGAIAMRGCTHHWTVTSECPSCLRRLLDRALDEIAKQVFSSRVVFDRDICDMAQARFDTAQTEYEKRLGHNNPFT